MTSVPALISFPTAKVSASYDTFNHFPPELRIATRKIIERGK